MAQQGIRPAADARLSGRRLLLLLTVQAAVTLPWPAQAASPEQLMRLLQQRSCPDCRLQDADLVQADLRDADLRRARLQRANLSGARLDGARLVGADLSFTSLQGASLRGADLRGASLEGTDLRASDLSGAQLDPGALARTHWSQARGLQPGSLTYAQLHNAGVEASQGGNPPRAEDLFGQAIALRPDAAITWLARGIVRNEQGKTALAAQDFRYAAALYAEQGETETAKQITQAAIAIEKPAAKGPGGNGAGSAFLSGTVNLFQGLAPLAIKLLPLLL
jgi:tetratricopeptide (TPR) repeat protein